MTDSIRQQIMSAIDTRLKGILTSGGYKTNVGQHVYDWRAEELSEDLLSALIYRDVSCVTELTNIGAFTHRLTVQIEIAAATSTPMAEVRKILADIDKAIGVDISWGGLAVLTERVGDESQLEEEENKFAGCITTVVITFRTQGWDDDLKI